MATRKKPGSDKRSSVNLDGISLEMGIKPPQAIDVEEAVLGALLVEPEVVSSALDDIDANCFYKEANRKVFEAISALASERSPIDIYTVSQQLQKNGTFEEVGGAYFLTQLSLKIGAAAHIEQHCRILRQKYVQRTLITNSYAVLKDAFDDSVNVDALLDKAQEAIFSIVESNIKNDVRPIHSIINDAIEDISKNQERGNGLSGLPSGMEGLDRKTLGWQPSDLIIVAARPSMGKTAFVLNIARNMTVDYNIPVAFFTLEMPSIQLVKRLMISETGLSSDKIKGGVPLESYEWVQLNERIKGLAKAPLYIDESSALSVGEFRTKARRMVQKYGVKMIIIDYLQLMTGPQELRGMREQEVAAISRALKATAKELNVPIIALSQLNRSVVTRTGSNSRPQLSDLRESGSIEQDADIVMFVHRYDYGVTPDDPNDIGRTDIIIAKHRNGETCDVPMRFRSSEMRFVDDISQSAFLSKENNYTVSHVNSKMNEDGLSYGDMPASDEF